MRSQILILTIIVTSIKSDLWGKDLALKMVYTRSHRATFTSEWTYNFPEHESTRWVIALRKPPELLWSRDVEAIAELKTSQGWIPFEKTTEGSPEERDMLLINYKHDDPMLKHGFTIRTVFTATIFHQELRKGKDTKPLKLSEEEVAFSSRATETYDFETQLVKKWMDENSMWKAKSESEIEFALRMYRHLRKSIPYSIADGGRWSCSQILKTGFGECCRHAIVGTSILRANGIPARTVCAVWAIDSTSKDSHCWGEFYIEGIGWIPYDTTLENEVKSTDRHFGAKKGELLGGMVNFDWQIDAGTLGAHTVFGIDAWPAFWSEGSGALNGPPPSKRTAVSLPSRARKK